MRKLIVSNLVTLDGFFARSNGDLDWHHTDAEFDVFAAEQLQKMDAILLGRATYELFASYWPTEPAIAEDPETAEGMNSLEKIVFSTTLDSVSWGSFNNARLVKDDSVGEINRLKQQEGKNLVIFGSGTLISSLVPSGGSTNTGCWCIRWCWAWGMGCRCSIISPPTLNSICCGCGRSNPAVC
jgi:dihydrofolate reductase